MKKHLLQLLTVSVFCFNITEAQNNTKQSTNDSLSGFNESQFRELASYKGINAEEMEIYISYEKRNYINEKYNLISSIPVKSPVTDFSSAKTSSAVCNNEDFEAFGSSYPIPSTVTIVSNNGIPGWNAASGLNNGTTNGSCNLTSCCTGAPNALQIIAPGTAGLIDPIIGASYPIHSVFGNNLNTAATALNGFNCYGNWFAKINNATAGAGLTRLTKTITVSPSNVIFNFAYMAIVQAAHCCCDNGGVSIKFRDCLGNLLASASQFSISPPATSACTPSGSCTSPSTITVLNAPTVGWYYNKWVNSTIDLSLWMGTCITIEVTGIDCPYSGHGGYAYFDAQCASVVINSLGSLNDQFNFKIYPNPSAGNFNVDISLPIINAEMEIRNVLGQTVHKQQVKQGNNQINTQNLAKGIYTYAVLQNKELVNTGKLLIE